MKVPKKLIDMGLFTDPNAPPSDDLQDLSQNGKEANQSPPVQRPSSVANILLQRRGGGDASLAAAPIQVQPPAPVVSIATPRTPADPEIVSHFRQVADRAQTPVYAAFLGQVQTLSAYIKDEPTLYRAALDSSKADIGVILEALQSRIDLVDNEKAGGIRASQDEKQQKAADNEARAKEIRASVDRLNAEIRDRQNQIRSLEAEGSRIAGSLGEVEATYQHDVDILTVAADVVLAELRTQADKLRKLKGGS